MAGLLESVAAPSKDAAFETLFQSFASFGEKENKGGTISLKNIDKWISQAGLSKKLTTTDTAILFSKFAKGEKHLSMNTFQEFLTSLVESKKMDMGEVKGKLSATGVPGTSHVTQAIQGGAAAAAMDRLTDTSKYTGTHKERFDESGHGKGLEGRTDTTSNDGYVQGYQNKDTYDGKEHKTEESEKKTQEK